MIYIIYSFGKNDGKREEKRYPAFIIAKSKTGNDEHLKKNNEYLLQIWTSFPQNVNVKILNVQRLFSHYSTFNEFLKDWEPLFDDTDKMQVYLGGEYVFDFPKNFDKIPEIAHYDTSNYAYLKNLFERYLETHKEEKENLRKTLREININMQT